MNFISNRKKKIVLEALAASNARDCNTPDKRDKYISDWNTRERNSLIRGLIIIGLPFLPLLEKSINLRNYADNVMNNPPLSFLAGASLVYLIAYVADHVIDRRRLNRFIEYSGSREREVITEQTEK